MRRKLHGPDGVLVLAILLGSSLPGAAAPPGCTFLADEFVRVGNGSTIDGDLGANRAGGFAHLGRRVELADDTTVSAEAVDLLPGTSVFDVVAGTVDLSRGATVRGTTTTATFPRVTPFCPTPPVTCGGPDVRVEKNGAASLTPGSYGRVVVENGGALGLAVGAYTFCALRTGRNAAVAIRSPGATTIAVAGELVLENGSTLRPDAGAAFPEIVVAGDRLKLAPATEVRAVIIAGPARATIGRGATLEGSLCADALATGRNVALRCTDEAPSTTSTPTTTSTSTTTAPGRCGDGTLDPGEQCDPGSPGGAFELCEGRDCTPACACEPPPPTSSTSTTVVPTTVPTTTVPTTSTSLAPTTTTLVTTTTSTSVPPTTTSTTAPSSTTIVPTTSTTSTLPTTSSTSTAPTTSSTSTIPTTSSSSSSTSTTSTTAAPTTTQLPTTTTSSTTTSTITFPLNCGNGNTNTGETCDDGNNGDNDACPSDCRIDACTPLTTTQRFVQVRFAPPEGGLVAGLTMLLDYPEGSVDLPGNGTTIPSGTISGVPTGAFVSVNDLNSNQKGHAARITVGAGGALPAGQVVRLRFNDCQGATVPAASAFRCTVLTASDPFLNAVNGVTCAAVVE